MKVVTSFYICTKNEKGELIKILEFADLDMAKHWAVKYGWTREKDYQLLEAPASQAVKKSIGISRRWWKSSWEAEKKPMTPDKMQKLTRSVSDEMIKLWRSKKRLARKL